MRIALIILHADAPRGGAERYTLDLAAALAGAGHEVTLLAASFGEVPVGVKTVSLPYRGLTRTGKYNRFLDALDTHLLQHRYDIVHAMLPVRRCDVYHPHAGVAAEAMRSGHLKYPNLFARVLAWLGTQINLRRRRFARVERELLTGPTPPTVLCLSDYVKQAVRRHYAISEDHLFWLFNCVDLRRFDPEGATSDVRMRWGIGDEQIMALMIAQDYQRKGLREAIRALAMVGDPRLRLVVVGRDDDTPYRKLARELNVAERVIFAGPTKDPRSFYAAADCFVLPTRHDPCSLVVLEALAMGVPVISTVQNGACEIMTDGREGFILPDPSDVSALAAALRAMLDPAARRRMRDACLALRPRLSQEEHLRRLLEAYEHVRKKEGPPAACGRTL